MSLKVAIFNHKGGVGKTSLAISLHEQLQKQKGSCIVVSNDKEGISEEVFDFYHYSEDVRDFKSDAEVQIFDFGGFTSKDVLDTIAASNVVIVPTLDDLNSLQSTIDTIAEIKPYNDNIIVIHNQSKEDTFVEKVIAENFDEEDVPVLKVRHSKIFQNSLLEGKNIEEIASSTGKNKFVYRNIIKEIKDIAEAVSYFE